jgi:hypothetical protein
MSWRISQRKAPASGASGHRRPLAPRIQSELQLLGYVVADSTVARYMCRHRKPPSQTWRTFIENHVSQIAAIGFFVVATVRFRLLCCFVVLRHDRNAPDPREVEPVEKGSVVATPQAGGSHHRYIRAA